MKTKEDKIMKDNNIKHDTNSDPIIKEDNTNSDPIIKEDNNIDSQKIIITQSFSFTIEHCANGSCNMKRINDGFNIHELMGHISFIQLEICKQMAGEIKPYVITRTVIVDKDE